MKEDDIDKVNEDIIEQFNAKFGKVGMCRLGGFQYFPIDESLYEPHNDDTFMVFPLYEVALDAAGLEDIMRRSLEQGKDLLFPLVKPYAWRTEPGVLY